MKIDRTKNAIRNTKWGFVQRLVNVFLPFLVRTLLIHVLSAEYGGISSLFTSILQILSLSELGFSNAIVFSMYKPIAEDDKPKICALLNIYKKAYLIVGTVILGIGVILIPFLPDLIEGEPPSDTNLYILYLIYLVNNVISYFLFGYKTSLLSAHQREDVISKNTLMYNTVLYAAQCIVIVLFKNYYVYAVTIPLGTVLLNILNNRAVNRMFPDYLPAGTIDEEEKASLKKNIMGLMIWKIGGATRNTFDSLVCSMFIGLVAVAMYNNYFYVMSSVSVFLGVILNSITGGIGNKIAVESPERNYEDFKKFHFLYMYLSGWCTVCLMCMYQPFMKLWMGEDLMFPTHIMFLFCYYFFMLKQGDINGVYYQAAGLWWEGKLRSVVEAVLNIGLNFILGKFFGVTGIVLATIISYTCIYFYGSSFVFTKYFKNGKLIKFYVDNVVYMLITAVIGGGTYMLIQKMLSGQDNTFIILAVSAAVCIVVPNILFLAVYAVGKENRTYLKGVFDFASKRVIK